MKNDLKDLEAIMLKKKIKELKREPALYKDLNDREKEDLLDKEELNAAKRKKIRKDAGLKE